MTKRPLSRNEFEQTEGAQRPPVVAPRGRSRLRERPGGVAARRRSGSLFASYLAASLRSRRSQLERPYGVALAKSLSCLRAMETRATSGCRSAQVALKGCHSDFTVSLRWGRSHALLVQWSPLSPFLSSKCTQMSPRTPCGTPIPDKDSCMQNAT